MEYEAFKMRSIIFTDKSRLKRYFTFFDDAGSSYRFLIDWVGHNALEIVGFFKYEEIADEKNAVARQLKYIISPSATYASTLRQEAESLNQFHFGVKINICGDTYLFKTDGFGPSAVKISYQPTYDDILSSKSSLERILGEIIHNTYSNQENDTKLLGEIDEKWMSEMAKKRALRAETLKKEEIRRKKQEELEEFLRS